MLKVIAIVAVIIVVVIVSNLVAGSSESSDYQAGGANSEWTGPLCKCSWFKVRNCETGEKLKWCIIPKGCSPCNDETGAWINPTDTALYQQY